MLSDYDDPLKVLQSFVGMLEDTVESTAWVSLNSSFLSQHIHHSQLLGIWDADRDGHFSRKLKKCCPRDGPRPASDRCWDTLASGLDSSMCIDFPELPLGGMLK